MDWEPHGHPPPGVYDVPHFDFHFYMITPEERAGIDGSTGGQDPAAEFVPAHYVSGVDVVPQMECTGSMSRGPNSSPAAISLAPSSTVSTRACWHSSSRWSPSST
jgi:hypothetical protein